MNRPGPRDPDLPMDLMGMNVIISFCAHYTRTGLALLTDGERVKEAGHIHTRTPLGHSRWLSRYGKRFQTRRKEGKRFRDHGIVCVYARVCLYVCVCVCVCVWTRGRRISSDLGSFLFFRSFSLAFNILAFLDAAGSSRRFLYTSLHRCTDCSRAPWA